MRLESIVGHILELSLLFEKESKPVDQIAWKFFKDRTYLGARDRFRIREAVFGMQRNKRLVEWLSDEFFHTHPDVPKPDTIHLKFLPRYIVQAYLINKHPADDMITGLDARWQAFFSGCTLAEYLQWIESYSETISKLPTVIEQFGIKYSFPDWMVERLSLQYKDETEALLKSLNRPARVTLRVNTLKATKEQCVERLKGEGVETIPTTHSPVGLVATGRFNRHALKSFKDGWFEIQDEGSQLISIIANPKPGNFVIDACAGGGGKTLHLVELMNDKGTVLAIDIAEKRISGLDSRKTRSGLRSIKSEILNKLPEGKYDNKADVVLVDAPCSGSGRIRRNPDLKWKLTPSVIDGYPKQQKEILQFNAKFVKPGGCLVYATCSLFRSENEDVITEFLSKNTDFVLKSPIDRMKALGIEMNEMVVRLLPYKLPTDAFFVAVMERVS